MNTHAVNFLQLSYFGHSLNILAYFQRSRSLTSAEYYTAV